jgi:diketogulonate reductase-like aldo/keto reductase
MGYESALAAFEASLSRLGLDYVDLYLIHWPGNDAKLRQQSWQALEEIKNSGRARAIGVSNYQVSHLEELLSHAATKPAANQIELHPFIYEQQKPILDFCREQGIAVEAYSPLAQAGNLNEPALEEIARQYSKSPAQVMLRWAIAHRTTPLPRSRNPERIRENIDIFDFDLTPADMQRLNGLSNGRSALH